jgi:hypothetical protein
VPYFQTPTTFRFRPEWGGERVICHHPSIRHCCCCCLRRPTKTPCVCVSAAVIFPAQSPKIPARNAGGGGRDRLKKASASRSASTKLFYSYTTRQFSFPICSGAIQNVFQLTEATAPTPGGQSDAAAHQLPTFLPPHPPSAIKKQEKIPTLFPFYSFNVRHRQRPPQPSADAAFSAFKPITSRPQFIPVMILPSLTRPTFIFSSAPTFNERHFLDYGQLESNSA